MSRIGMMATYPARRDSLLETLPTLFSQLDGLYLYCNEYTQKDLIDLNHWIQGHNNGCQVKLVHGPSDRGDIKDMGKFWAVGMVEGYIFLVDDDLLYPPNYCKKHIQAIEQHGQISTVHGRVITTLPMEDYFKDTRSLHYRQAVKKFERVDIAGTGTVAFSTQYVTKKFFANDSSMEKFQGLSDIWFSCMAYLRKLSIFCIPRRHQWLKDTKNAKQTSSLYQLTKQDPKKPCLTLNQFDWHD